MQDLKSDPVFHPGLGSQTNSHRSMWIGSVGTAVALDADLHAANRMSLHIFHVHDQDAGLGGGDRAGQARRQEEEGKQSAMRKTSHSAVVKLGDGFSVYRFRREA